MVFLSNSDGTIQQVFPSPTYQGSIDANKIILLAPFAACNKVTATFRLPDGTITAPRYMANTNLPGIQDPQKKGFNAWFCDIDEAVTGISGSVTVSFSVYMPTGEIGTATDSASNAPTYDQEECHVVFYGGWQYGSFYTASNVFTPYNSCNNGRIYSGSVSYGGYTVPGNYRIHLLGTGSDSYYRGAMRYTANVSGTYTLTFPDWEAPTGAKVTVYKNNSVLLTERIVVAGDAPTAEITLSVGDTVLVTAGQTNDSDEESVLCVNALLTNKQTLPVSRLNTVTTTFSVTKGVMAVLPESYDPDEDMADLLNSVLSELATMQGVINTAESAIAAEIAASRTATAAANDAAANANTKAGMANTAAGAANTAAANANEKAGTANEAANAANTAATLATEKAGLADTAASNANEKAGEASEAAQSVDAAKELAVTAAGNANTAATTADTAASGADAAAVRANQAADDVLVYTQRAETAAQNAEQSNQSAVEHESGAEEAEAAAIAAKEAAAQAKTEAETAESNAASSASAAEDCAASALERKNAASGHATEAQTSAIAAAASAAEAEEAVSEGIETHNASADAHPDIRALTPAHNAATDAHPDIRADITEIQKTMPRVAVNSENTSASKIVLPNTPETLIKSTDYGTIFTHKRLYNGALYDEGFNQLLNPANYPTTRTIKGIAFTNDADGKITASGTATGGDAEYSYFNTRITGSLTAGHKYAVRGCPAGGGYAKYMISDVYSGAANDYGSGAQFVYANQIIVFAIVIKSGVTVSNLVFYPQLVDLTAIYGAGNEPSTVAEFTAKYPDFYPYVPFVSPTTPLEIVPTGNATKISVKGKNLTTAQQVYTGASNYAEETFEGKNCVRFTSGTQIKNSPIAFEEGVQYTVSFQYQTRIKQAGGGAECIFVFFYTDGTSSSIHALGNKNTNDWVSAQLTSDAGKTVKRIGLKSVDYLTYVYVDVDTFQLERGAEKTAYVPYTVSEQTVSHIATDPANQYYIDNAVSMGDYASERTGNTVTVKAIRYVFDGTEAFGMITSDPVHSFFVTTSALYGNGKATTHPICTHYPTVPFAYNTTKGAVTFDSGANTLYFTVCDDYATTADFKVYFAAQYAAGTPVEIAYILKTSVEVEIEPITDIPTVSDGTTLESVSFTDTDNVQHAPAILDMTNYIISRLGKAYGLLKDPSGSLIIPYAQTNMLMDTNTGKYISDLINLKDTATETVYKIQVTNGAIVLTAVE